MIVRREGIHYEKGRLVAKAIIDGDVEQILFGTIDLLYQHGTISRYLTGLCDVLQEEKRFTDLYNMLDREREHRLKLADESRERLKEKKAGNK